MSDPYDRVLVPLANVEDAERSADAVAAAFDEASVVAVYVVEKAGGAADSAGVEQRSAFAEDLFEAFESGLEETDLAVETRLAYGVNVPETIVDLASELGSEAIVLVPRGGSRVTQLLTGDVARRLINRTDRPVLVLPTDG